MVKLLVLSRDTRECNGKGGTHVDLDGGHVVGVGHGEAHEALEGLVGHVGG